MNTLSRKTLFSLAATAAAMLITAAVAVPIARATTQARLQKAAQQVCGEDPDTRMQLALARLARSCEQQAIGSAVDQIHTAPLTAIFVHHFPERRGTAVVETDGRG